MGGIYSSIRNYFYPKEDYNIVIIGFQNAGKTTLFELIRDKNFKEIKIPTIGFDFDRIMLNGIDVLIWDMGGQEKTMKIWKHYLKRADLLIYVIDIQNKNLALASLDKLQSILENIYNTTIQEPDDRNEFPILIVFNKIDLNPDSQLEPNKAMISEYIQSNLLELISIQKEISSNFTDQKKQRSFQIHEIYVSAKTGQNMDLLKGKIKEQMILAR